MIISLKPQANFGKFLLVGIFLFLMGCIGCGYSFRSTSEPIGTEIKSIAIPLMESTSTFIGFEAEVTRIIRQEFASHAKIPLASREKAEVVLIGKIYQIETEPLSYNIEQTIVQGQETTYEVTDRRRLKVRLHAKLIDNKSGKIIWEDNEMEENAAYDVVADPLNNRYNQKRAIQIISKRLAEKIYMKTLERF
jgi:hypothetical protein